MATRRLLTALTLGLAAAAPASALDFGDFTFTGLQLPTDASMNGEVVVGHSGVITGFGTLGFIDIFTYDNANNNFFNIGSNSLGGPGTSPEVSYDGTRIPGVIDSPDFGNGTYDTAGVWTQDAGQPFGTGTWTDLLAIDSPNPSEAYNNYVLGVNPPTAFDGNLGSGYGISGDGNVVTGNFYRKDFSTPGFSSGGIPGIYDVAGGSTTSLSESIGGNKGQVLASNYDGSVVAGFTDNPFIPTVWVNGVETQFTHADGNSGRAIAVSDDGTRVAGYQRVFDEATNSNTQAQVFWDYNAGTQQWDRVEIGRVLGRTEGTAEVTGMTADGSLIVGYDTGIAGVGDYLGTAGTWEATFWSENTGLVMLEDFLTARGLNLTGLDITALMGISPDGGTLLAWALTGNTPNDLTGIIIDVSDTPLNPDADNDLRNTAIANLGTSASYAGDTYYGDWNHDGLVTQEDLDILNALIDGVTGDLNGDLFVGIEDLDILLANWGDNVTPGSLIDGDANNDGMVDDLDLAIVQANWGNGVAPGGVVPEPTSLALLGLGGLALMRRRRRTA